MCSEKKNNYGAFYVNLAYPFAQKFGSDYMQLRSIIHHLHHCFKNGIKEPDFKLLSTETGYDDKKIVAIIEWLQEQMSDKFEIEWT